MHDIEEIPMAEIASALSILRFTGYSRLRRARKVLAAAVASVAQGRRL
jgi:DNA-directed RNA polymerase specialized sigma24 family protein